MFNYSYITQSVLLIFSISKVFVFSGFFPSLKGCSVGLPPQEITEYSNTSQVVCVVCTERMGNLLRDEAENPAKIVKSVIESRPSSSISVIFDRNCQIAQMEVSSHPP